MQTNRQLRLLVIGAHPDDAEFHAGGLMVRYRQAGHVVRAVSVTNGAAGHHLMQPTDLATRRRQEAQRAGEMIGAEYHVWSFPDGQLIPSLDVRHRVVEEIRTFRPDLVLTHRTNDYHPDHRAVAQAVQDASYLVTVPLVRPDVPFLRQDPVVAYMVDLFTKPIPLEPHVALDISKELDSIVAMLACHESQVFEFLPFNQGIEGPADDSQRMAWLKNWYCRLIAPRADRFRLALADRIGSEAAAQTKWLEAYEISEYARRPTADEVDQLFLLR